MRSLDLQWSGEAIMPAPVRGPLTQQLLCLLAFCWGADRVLWTFHLTESPCLPNRSENLPAPQVQASTCNLAPPRPALHMRRRVCNGLFTGIIQPGMPGSQTACLHAQATKRAMSPCGVGLSRKHGMKGGLHAHNEQHAHTGQATQRAARTC